tara:strand:+ start:238 stop:540 length:303 start_codon:yes stop_codon:yes gene_type:complete
MKIKILMLFVIFVNGCGNISQSKNINKELKFYFKGQVNLYSENKQKNIIKKFYEYSDIENTARQNSILTCSNYVKINKLNNVNCKYMGTKHTERMLTSFP